MTGVSRVLPGVGGGASSEKGDMGDGGGNEGACMGVVTGFPNEGDDVGKGGADVNTVCWFGCCCW